MYSELYGAPESMDKTNHCIWLKNPVATWTSIIIMFPLNKAYHGCSFGCKAGQRFFPIHKYIVAKHFSTICKTNTCKLFCFLKEEKKKQSEALIEVSNILVLCFSLLILLPCFDRRVPHLLCFHHCKSDIWSSGVSC